MTSLMQGARTLRGALVSIDATTGSPSVVAFQYNPTTVKRTLKPSMSGGDAGDRTEAVRLTGAPQETISLEVELDATDALEKGESLALSAGLHPQIAALELLTFPPSSRVALDAKLLSFGVIEIAPTLAPRLLFVWGAKRVQPVQVTGFSVSEEEFDTNLNPVRVTVSLELRVLTYSDLSSGNPDHHQYLAYQQGLESLAARVRSSDRTVTGAAL